MREYDKNRRKFMKKILLLAVILIGLSGAAFCAEKPVSNMDSEVHQKACQNVFSLINIDMSVMSPRATMADSPMDARTITAPQPPKGKIVPICDKREMKPCPCECGCHKPCPEPQNKPKNNQTSLFRIDLLHLIKFQIL